MRSIVILGVHVWPDVVAVCVCVCVFFYEGVVPLRWCLVLRSKWAKQARDFTAQGPRPWISKLGLGPLGQPIYTKPSAAQVWLVVVPVLELEVVGWWGPSNAQPRCRQPSTFFPPLLLLPRPGNQDSTAPGWPSNTHRRQHGGGWATHWTPWWRTGHDASPSCTTKGGPVNCLTWSSSWAARRPVPCRAASATPRVKDSTGIPDPHGLPTEAGRRRRRWSPELLSPGTHSCLSSSFSFSSPASCPAVCAPAPAGLLVVVAYRAVSWLPIEISEQN